MTPALLCATLEVALNRYLGLEDAALAECARLSGRVLALQVEGWDWTIALEPHAGGVRLSGQSPHPPDVLVRGTPPRLLQLAWRGQAASLSQLDGITIEGDAALLQRFWRVLAGIGLEPEELLVPLLGPSLAHRLGRSLQHLAGLARQGWLDVSLNAAEYLREETRDLARAADVESFTAEVEALRERTDRFEAALRRAERRLEART